MFFIDSYVMFYVVCNYHQGKGCIDPQNFVNVETIVTEKFLQ